MISIQYILYFMLMIHNSKCSFLDKAKKRIHLLSLKNFTENVNDHNNVPFGNQNRIYTSTTQTAEQMFSTVDYETDTEIHDESNFTISVDWGQTNLSSMW